MKYPPLSKIKHPSGYDIRALIIDCGLLNRLLDAPIIVHQRKEVIVRLVCDSPWEYGRIPENFMDNIWL